MKSFSDIWLVFSISFSNFPFTLCSSSFTLSSKRAGWQPPSRIMLKMSFFNIEHIYTTFHRLTTWSKVSLFPQLFPRKPKELRPISYEWRAAIGSPSWFFVCFHSRGAWTMRTSMVRRARKWWDRRIESEKNPTRAEAACWVMAKWLAGRWTPQGKCECV